MRHQIIQTVALRGAKWISVGFPLLISCTNPLGSGGHTDAPFLGSQSSVVTSISTSSGINQTAGVGSALSAFYAVVKDNNGKVMPSITVNWVVSSGGGSLSSASSTTDSNGLSSTILTLGPAAATNTVTATVSGTAISTSFSAVGAWDTDANSYFSRLVTANAGVDPVSTTEKENINSFIVGLKANNLWTSVVEAWTLRSGQNIGNGTTLYAMKNSNDGNIFNNPTWGTNGLSMPSQTPNAGVSIGSISTTVIANAQTLISVSQSTSGASYIALAWNSTGGGQDGTGGYVLGCSGSTYLSVERGGTTSTSICGSDSLNVSNFHMYAVGGDISLGSMFIFTDSNTPQTTPLNGSGSFTAVNPLYIGTRNGLSGGQTSQTSFVILFNKDIRGTSSAFYNLYKTTIGQNLSLP